MEHAIATCDDVVEGFEEGEDILGPDDVVADGAGAGIGKKKGESHRIGGFIDEEDLMLSDFWLAVRQDSICGTQQKGKTYWRKETQEFHEKHLHRPYPIYSTRNKESIKKRWNYIKQETMSLATQKAGVGVVVVLPRALEYFKTKHNKGFHMVHCWNALKEAPKWRLDVEAYMDTI
ncbi:hypothetical protein QYE76_047244 [Lolium multiflorum]|uniref:Uncharacterized protein n=1 Tax=Lolium multiflorum TaxID=4521 RepID=A0AAD8TRI6_LOLMU|nr:hypothetical protein QYE76_047244 [Lolium multiflorum]